MAASDRTDFLAGVIEGFYGPPWSPAERLELFDWMATWGLNTYLYAPKDDLKHRALWREPYSTAEAGALGELIRACQQRGLRFIYALSPGLDLHYGDPADRDRLRARFGQMLRLEVRDFALLFDDIPDQLSPVDARRWGSFASAQSDVANDLFRWTRERSPAARFLFCPTPYCGRMAQRQFGGEGYLDTIGRELLPEIEVCWTGPEIVSREISVAHVRELRARLHRKPMIWDNVHANDYDGRRFYCGPYAGRSPALRQEVSGLLSNPNNEFPLNYVPLRTLAEFACVEGEWDARQAYLTAMQEWWPQFATVGRPLSLDDLVLFGDCYYLPYDEGPEAESLYQQARRLLSTPGATWESEAAAFRQKVARLREFCTRLTELRHRPLFYALSRRVWELREELDLLERYVEHQTDPSRRDTPFHSDFHQLGTYRGGFVPRLQQLLRQQADGSLACNGNPNADKQPPHP